MGCNLTRFYFDVDEDGRTGIFNGKVFKDVETVEADAYEQELQDQQIPYLRVDL
jgi:hypothetical protein